jgi:hypothetical protein
MVAQLTQSQGEPTMPTPPATMSAVAIAAPGGPEVLKATELPTPKPAAGQLLVKVAAAGVNRPDVAQRMGVYPPPPGHSPLPGLEIAGEVVEAGPETTRWKPGDKVCALVNGGGYAAYCIAEETSTLPIPAGCDMVRAAALPETFFTVWNNVFERGALAAVPGARRHQRHRHYRHPARQGLRRARAGHSRLRRQVQGLPGFGSRPGGQLQDGGFRRHRP